MGVDSKVLFRRKKDLGEMFGQLHRRLVPCVLLLVWSTQICSWRFFWRHSFRVLGDSVRSSDYFRQNWQRVTHGPDYPTASGLTMVQAILLHQAYLWSRLPYCIRLTYGPGYPTALGLPVATIPWMFTWLLYFLPETALWIHKLSQGP